MEALKFNPQNKELYLVTKDIPCVSKKDDVLVKIVYAGICGTDLHIIEGEFPCKQDGPFTLGHEFTGIVEEIGCDVKHVKKGDRIVVDPNGGCNICNFCHLGSPHFCKVGGINNTIGIFSNGGWAEYCITTHDRVTKIPDKISFENAVLCEPLSCLAHGWDRISPVTVGQKILVIGAGIIGNLWIAALHLQGHRHVTVSEPNINRLKQIEKLNTGYSLLTPDQLKIKAINEPNYLFDIVIDCSGFSPAIEHAFGLLNHGGKLCIFGVAHPNSRISISPFEVYLKEISIIGVIINPYAFPKALGLIEAMQDRYLGYEKLGIKVFKLNQYKEAIGELKSGTISKAMFRF